MMSGSGLILRAWTEIKRSVNRISAVCNQFSQDNSQNAAMAVVASNRTSKFAFERGTRAVYKRNAPKGETGCRNPVGREPVSVVLWLYAVLYRASRCQMTLAELAWFNV